MGQLHTVLSPTQSEPWQFSARLVSLFIKRGIDPLDANGSFRCWACGSSWDGAEAKPEEFWWLCPCLCNADHC
jgi:hypothetical protein